MPSVRPVLTLGLAAGLAFASPAVAQVQPGLGSQPVQLTAQEAEALKLRLIMAKPNVSTVTIASFVFPGSAQAYMGHVDRTLVMWGTYILGYTVAAIAIPDSLTAGPSKVRDLALVGAFMGIAGWSALDAYLLAQQRRADYDLVINRLTERTSGLSPAAIMPVRPE